MYKALLGGVQPVAVKVIPFDASDKERADFDKEVGSPGVLIYPCRPHACAGQSTICACKLEYVPAASATLRLLCGLLCACPEGCAVPSRWRCWSRAATATWCSSWAPAATAPRRCWSPSALLSHPAADEQNLIWRPPGRTLGQLVLLLLRSAESAAVSVHITS